VTVGGWDASYEALEGEEARFSSVGVSWALAIGSSAPDPGSNPG